MSGFEQLEEAIQQPQITITPDDVAFSDEELSDDVALAIVLQDTTTAENYLQSKGLIATLDAADDLYRAYVKPKVWGNGKPRSNLSSPVVLEAIESKLVPTLHTTLWGNGKEPFTLIPTGKTTPAAARAKGKILSWAIKQAGLKEEMRRALKTCLQYGFVVGNWGWESKEQKVKQYVRENGQITSKVITKDISQPFYKTLDLRKVLVDPAADTQDVRKSAKYVILQMSITANDLDDLRADPGYKNVPTRDELAVILANNNRVTQDSLRASKSNQWRDLQAESDFTPTTLDPLSQPLEILERWDDDRVITVLNRCIVIRNEANEFGRKTQVSCAFIDVLGSAWGFGVAKLLSGEQRFQTGVKNLWIDSLALTMNPMFQLSKGLGIGTQNISAAPGKVVTESGELKPLSVASVTTEAMNALGSSEERANRLVGANGGSGMPDQAMRTAEGVSAFTGDVIQRLQYFLEIFVELVFVPVLEAFLEMCCDRLSEEQLGDLLTAADGKAYEGDILDVYGATCGIEILAGTKLTTRRTANQIVPALLQFAAASPVQDSLVIQNKKLNYVELLTQYIDLNGWEVDSLIVDMTPEDQQRAQMMNPAFIKGQQDLALEQQRHTNDLDNIDAKATAQAGVSVIKNAVKEHTDEASSVLNTLQSPSAGVTDGQ